MLLMRLQEWPLGAEHDLWPGAVIRLRLQSYNHEKPNSDNNSDLQRELHSPDDNHSLADTLMEAP